MSLISVIVPVYKAEQYLHRCVDSILAQTYTDFELLLIDDGSPDNCGAICDEYAAKDSRVCVFHKTNGGVSSARNLGLDNARGEWVTFIDSDDYVHPDFLNLVNEHNKADFVVASFQLVGTDEKWDSILDDSFMDADLIEDDIVSIALRIHFRMACLKFFRRDILSTNTIRFDEKVHSSEDWLFVLNYLLHISSIKTCANSYYYYERENGGSLSQNTCHFSSYFYAMDAFRNVTNVLKERFNDTMEVVYLESIRGYCARQCHYLYYSSEFFCKKIKKIHQMYKNPHLKILFSNDKVKWRKKIKLFHWLMSKGLLFVSLVYIYMLKGKIYE